MSCCRKRLYDIYTGKEKECDSEDKKEEKKKNIQYLILCGACIAVGVISVLLK
ncbi:MAG: hypothetical protein LKJ13_01725 [Clostridia bacterium]|jgi:hypothetical protein|nr:hypothetical protein [Clostridia bacterium]MCI1998997.1 hypothetical protein [Clostridia bacterium]MCI2013747.1 hypothetical protein [Clostridia bacterium]